MAVVERFFRTVKSLQSLELQELANKRPSIYLFLVTLTALAGYAYLLLYPATFAYSLRAAYEVLHSPWNDQSLVDFLLWSSFALLSAAISYRIFSIRFSPPDSIELTPKNAKPLYKLIKKIESEYHWPKIDNVVLTRRFELTINKTPVVGIPFWSHTTLVVGFPFLQALSPKQFHCMLTRTLWQYAKRRNIFYNWLNYLRSTWRLYPVSFKHRRKLGDQLVYWFFSLYSRFYDKLSIYAAQRDELLADSIALKTVNDADLFKAIEATRLTRDFMRTYYWPTLDKLITSKKQHPGQIKPFSRLPQTLRESLYEKRSINHLNRLSHEVESKHSSEPPFAARMENIGYNKPTDISAPRICAAQVLFRGYYTKVVKLMDNLWANKHMDHRQHPQLKAQNTHSFAQPKTEYKPV